MEILLANPRGFCAGVDRAIEMVERALDRIGAPIYVRHEVVHNKFVVENLRQRGAIFTDHLEEVPEGHTVIFSAHGVSQAVRAQAKEKNLTVLDATCPLVTKVHIEVARHSRLGRECILIGHEGHPEVEGTTGQYNNPEGGIYIVESVEDVEKLQVKNPGELGVVTQTTLSVDDTAEVLEAINKKFPKVISPKTEDICYATTNRQEAVRKIAPRSDVFLVVGSKTSSNSNRLRELAERFGCDAYLVDRASDVNREWFKDANTVGVTAGASAPEKLVQEVVAQLKGWGGSEAQEIAGREETIVFPLPKVLRDPA